MGLFWSTFVISWAFVCLFVLCGPPGGPVGMWERSGHTAGGGGHLCLVLSLALLPSLGLVWVTLVGMWELSGHTVGGGGHLCLVPSWAFCEPCLGDFWDFGALAVVFLIHGDDDKDVDE
eukprot:12415684-Karenia_brevis.AAC.1